MTEVGRGEVASCNVGAMKTKPMQGQLELFFVGGVEL